MLTDENMSKRTVLMSGVLPTTGASMDLTHKTAGMEIAGSGTRKTGEAWGVLFPYFRTGQWFSTKEEAETRFNELLAS